MNQPIDQLADDLRFVRQAVETSHGTQYRSIAIPALWAGVITVGFMLNDFWHDTAVVWYWAIVPAVAGLLSGWIGSRIEHTSGVRGDLPGSRVAAHWCTIGAGFIVVAVIMGSHHLDWSLGGQLMTLVFGIVYFLAGLHLDRRFLWPGAAAVAGSAAIGHLGQYSWTIVGVVISLALVASALFMKGSHVQSTNPS